MMEIKMKIISPAGLTTNQESGMCLNVDGGIGGPGTDIIQVLF